MVQTFVLAGIPFRSDSRGGLVPLGSTLGFLSFLKNEKDATFVRYTDGDDAVLFEAPIATRRGLEEIRGNAGKTSSIFWETKNTVTGFNRRHIFHFQNQSDLVCALVLLFGAAGNLSNAISATREFFDPDGDYVAAEETVPAHDIAKGANDMEVNDEDTTPKFSKPSYTKDNDDQWCESQAP